MFFVPVIPTGGLAGLAALDASAQTQRRALEADPVISRNIEIFDERIGSVSTVDDLLKDRALLEVALTAYGLQDEINDVGFIRRVLEEGTENEASFANRLQDPRWREFSEALGFGNKNAGREQSDFEILVASKFTPPPTQTRTIEPTALSSLRTSLETMTSIADLTSSPSTLDTALKIFGITRVYETDAFFNELLTEGTDNFTDLARTQSNTGYIDFTDAFSPLASGGPIPTVSRLQYEVEVSIERKLIDVRSASEFATIDAQATAALAEGATYTPPTDRITTEDLAYFQANIAGKTAAEIVADPVLKSVLLTAYGLETTDKSDAELQAILEGGGGSDGALAAQESDPDYRAMALAFEQSNSADPTENSRNVIQLAVEKEIAAQGLDAPLPEVDTPQIDQEELDYFLNAVGPTTTGAELLADKRAFTVALTAFGLENRNRSDAFWDELLTGDPNSPDYLLNFVTDPALTEFAQAFNPAEENTGPAASARFLQETEAAIATNGVTFTQEELDYLRANFDLVTDNLDIVIDDRLLGLTQKAFGFEEGEFTTEFTLRMIISDPNDPNSFLRRYDDPRWDAFARVFGEVQGANTGLDSFKTDTIQRYLDQSWEIAVGQVDQNLRLALNFRREIGEVANSATVAETGWAQLLSSRPLRTVVESAFNLPAETVNLDIDQQIGLFESRGLQILNANDPSVFTDADVVERVLQDFLLRQDIAAGPAPGSSGFAALTLVNNAVALSSVSFRA